MRSFITVAVALAIYKIAVASPGDITSAALTGAASVIDGDTIEIHGTRIRLWGIDAPEHDQLCRGEDSEQYHCGARAANKLDEFIGSRPVTCEPKELDRYRRTVAVCSVAGEDMSAWLISHGLALDWPKYSHGKYAGDQEKAKQAEQGLWSGSFVEPWNYRACRRAKGTISVCSEP